jgi:hypothetical protein
MGDVALNVRRRAAGKMARRGRSLTGLVIILDAKNGCKQLSKIE